MKVHGQRNGNYYGRTLITPETLGEIFLDATNDDKEMFCDDCKYELGLLIIPWLD